MLSLLLMKAGLFEFWKFELSVFWKFELSVFWKFELSVFWKFGSAGLLRLPTNGGSAVRIFGSTGSEF